VPLRHAQNAEGHSGEPGFAELQAGERLAGMRVEPRGHEQCLGRELVDDGLDDPLERADVVAVTRPDGHRQIDRIALAVALAALAEPSASRVKRPLMERAEEHPGLVVERRLGAVPVMDVPVDDRHPLQAGDEQLARRDGDVVEEAEPHRPVGRRMVTRRAHERERSVPVVP